MGRTSIVNDTKKLTYFVWVPSTDDGSSSGFGERESASPRRYDGIDAIDRRLQNPTINVFLHVVVLRKTERNGMSRCDGFV